MDALRAPSSAIAPLAESPNGPERDHQPPWSERSAHLRLLESGYDAVDRVPTSLVVARDAMSFDLDGVTRTLATRPLLRRLLLALVHARARGAALSVDDMFAAGWPGERATSRSKRDRVYTAVAQLRGAGLREVLTSGSCGYTLDVGVTVTLEE